MRVLVCGSRDFNNWTLLSGVLDIWREAITEILEGECPYGGADIMARDWGHMHGIKVSEFPPRNNTAPEFWRRNRAMIEEKPDLVIGFVNKARSSGTDGTLELARQAGIQTLRIEYR